MTEHTDLIAPDKNRVGFWSNRLVRRGLMLGLLFSCIIHALLVPWGFIFDSLDFRVNEVDGDLVVPIDFLIDPKPMPTTEPAASESTVSASVGGIGSIGPGFRPDAALMDAKVKDAGSSRDSHVDQDSQGSLVSDAKPKMKGEGGAPSEDGGEVDSGVRNNDASNAGDGVEGGVGYGMGMTDHPDASSTVKEAPIPGAGTPNADLIVNGAAIRSHPLGVKIGELMKQFHPWNILATTGINPIADTEAIRVFGPSFLLGQTENVAVVIRYTTDDALIDEAMDELAARSPPKSRPSKWTWGRVKAAMVRFDSADRVLLRGMGKTVVVVPPSEAKKFAAPLQKMDFNIETKAGEAVTVMFQRPHDQIPKIPDRIRVVKMVVSLDGEKGDAVVRLHAQCDSSEGAKEVAEMILSYRGLYDGLALFDSTLPKGLLNGLKAEVVGQDVKAQMPLKLNQLVSLYDYLEQFFEGRRRR